MINKSLKTKLLLLVIFLTITGVKSLAQHPMDSISKKLKFEFKRYKQEDKYDSVYYIAQKLKKHAMKIEDTVFLLKNYHKLGFYAYKNGNPILALGQCDSGLILKYSLRTEAYKLPLFYLKCEILNKFGDYKEAQKNAISGIDLAKKLDSLRYIHDFYNELAVSSANSLEFEIADDAYRSSLDYTENKDDLANILNNIAVNYKHQKKNKQAVRLYDSILNHVTFTSTELRARIKSNLGYSLSEIGNKDRALPLLKSALDTRIKEGDFSAIYASYIHLTKYYIGLDKNLAAYYAKKAYEVAYNKTKSPDSQVEALLNIITLNIASDQEAKRYAFLSDSIQRAERKTLNDYTAVKFQTKERELEIANQKEELAKKETQKTYYLFGLTTVGICLLSFFIYAFQRKKILQRNHKIATLEAREHERNNVSGKVHDYVADKIREVMSSADHYETKHPNLGFSSIADKAENAYEELRKVSQDYMHLDFNKIVFPKRIQGLLEEREKLYAIAMDAEGLGEIDWTTISIPIKTELYRSLQELLTNVSKHSKATQTLILFKEEKKNINMIVKDNGIGCNLSESLESTGLIDLKRRIDNLDGSVHISSIPNHGFIVNIGIPLI